MLSLKVISGGQTGADQGALFGARAAGWETGGTAPKGWRTDAGRAPWLADYGLVEHSSWQYGPRTLANVQNSHGTLIFGDATSPGCTLTRKHARTCFKPVQVLLWPGDHDWLAEAEAVADWMARMGITTLNVAGNRERSNPGIEAATSAFIQLLAQRIP